MASRNGRRLSKASNQKKVGRTQPANSETRGFIRLAHALTDVKELTSFLQTVAEITAEILSANRVILVTLDLETRQVHHLVKAGPGAQAVSDVEIDDLWNRLSDWVIKEKETALSPKSTLDPEMHQQGAENLFGAMAIVPICCRESLLGTLAAINSPDEPDFTHDTIELMMAVASQTAVVIENLWLHKKLQSSNNLVKQSAANVSLADETVKRDQEGKALPLSEEQYRLLVETMNDGLAVIDKELKFSYTNWQFCELLGYSPDELTHKPMEAYLDDASQKTFHEHILKRRNGEQSIYALNWITKGGTAVPTRVSGTPILAAKCEFLGSFAVVTDISEQKQAEADYLMHLRFLESMDQVNRAIQGAVDLEQMMTEVLDALLSIFDCDRTWLVYPCDPDAPTWQVPMERSRPEYSGVLPIGVELPLDPVVSLN
jgi:PAS domain S-box-containing protein